MRIATISTLAVIAVGLGGCATLNEDQCVQGDWYGIGRDDGAAGYQRGRLEDHAKACSKYGAVPDAAAYERGRTAGLMSYCTPARGFEEGRQGRSYGAVCPAGAEQGFLQGYADGGLVLAATRRVNDARSDASSAEARVRDLEGDIHSEEGRLANPELSRDEKQVIRERLKTLRDDRDRAQEDARRADRRERDAQYDLDSLRARFTPAYGTW